MSAAHQPPPPILDGHLRIGDSIRRANESPARPSPQIGVVEALAVMEGDGSGLTDAEHRFMELTADLMDLFVMEICGRGAAREHDIDEMAARIHAIQYPVLAQAAARAHPTLYRLLGGTLPDGSR